MKFEEFKQWLAYHMARYPNLETWLANLDKGETVSRKEVIQSWYSLLKSIDLQDAKKATDTLFESGVDLKPSETPRLIKETVIRGAEDLARQLRPKYAHGVETFTCKLCRDSGWVDIWHPDFVAALRKGDADAFPYKAVAYCTCAKGELRKRVSGAVGAATFDRAIHICRDECSLEELRNRFAPKERKEEQLLEI